LHGHVKKRPNLSEESGHASHHLVGNPRIIVTGGGDYQLMHLH
jgi:hypothetical protein